MPVYLNGSKVAPAKIFPPTHDGDYEIYAGPYITDPFTTTDVILETAQKILTKNITVHKIKYDEVSNLSGGNTAYIGI